MLSLTEIYQQAAAADDKGGNKCYMKWQLITSVLSDCASKIFDFINNIYIHMHISVVVRCILTEARNEGSLVTAT